MYSHSRAAQPPSSILGYPRIGPRRELKRALEDYWHGQSTSAGTSRAALEAVGRSIQEDTWSELHATGLTQVPGNTFSFYDHVLDDALLFGAVPTRFKSLQNQQHPLDFYFTLARGNPDLPPLELVRYFDTNYFYRQPEIDETTEFSLHAQSLVDEFDRALARGIELRPVVLGPLSLLLISKAAPGAAEGFSPLDRLDDLLTQYCALFELLAKRGATCIQLDEPAFTGERTESELAALKSAYTALSTTAVRPRLLVTGQYGSLGPALPILAATEIEAIGLDLVAGRLGPEELAAIPGMTGKRLYAGVINGRNVWRADRLVVLDYLERLRKVCPDLVVSTSSTLLHVPYDVLSEYDVDGNVADRLAFAKQKVGEVVALATALADGPSDKWRKRPTEVHFNQKHAVRHRIYNITDDMRVRAPYSERKIAQGTKLDLPLVPSTTLGSFPQSTSMRQARYELGQGRITEEDYRKQVESEIEEVIRLQEDIGLDVLVNGEVERNDMVQFFAEALEGFAVTTNGWVQAYGSRCVRPPILYGDVAREKPMSVEWTAFAQSLTDKPVKAILTGPVTMLARSFVRQDQPLYETADQVALVIRDEIADLEKAGICIVQVDEPALRELLPLREKGREEYLRWSVAAFRLATAGARPETQIHTHLAYSTRASVVDAIEKLDCDVTAVVATRSITWVLGALAENVLSHGVGPGIYESRSARIPDIDELDELLTQASKTIDIDRLWANPDGGLKTRHYWQLEPSLRNLVAAARRVRRRAEQGNLK
ncbi:5-methyltetrahydropteroyltriglutamate--homocysteine S-methyltransferase [Rhodococcus sp. G-MC3]|nr:5-methyltetrahydropteroyltriglutamate--homocysteine S-methyltransferase [Rhodococcus sp. G-MC3]MDJ0395985.1 5-methyltetrahydropteroyltriglutamate--homocysteine S-methyltransferase [Rhodococcus sp. G-MC3]